MNAPQPSSAELLATYDAQLRGEAEVYDALSWTRDGPLYRGVLDGGGFVSYVSLDGIDNIARLVQRTIGHYRDELGVDEFEWKTRGHDERAEQLHQELCNAGFIAEEPETVMVGAAELLSHSVAIPTTVNVRRVDNLAEAADLIARATAMQRKVFNGGPSAEEALARLHRSQGTEQFWVAEVHDEIVCAGRLTLIPNADFAGLWGGATHPDWRGKGIYRALTAARAGAALAAGKHYLQSDCSPMSRPILERSGLTAVTTTTPYIWHR
ncbi:GNAT family N-acetyltransferase [Ferrimicrobium sp.]|uniref:GNAT family N-acetyltransferase n=1 Tax=Ferrimicrobium sp. TaxID=2926050 RepID=UPI002617EFBE|nr:GNAT family N-acetyltransferase [Ferrimicrobium sp.]